MAYEMTRFSLVVLLLALTAVVFVQAQGIPGCTLASGINSPAPSAKVPGTTYFTSKNNATPAPAPDFDIGAAVPTNNNCNFTIFDFNDLVQTLGGNPCSTASPTTGVANLPITASTSNTFTAPLNNLYSAGFSGINGGQGTLKNCAGRTLFSLRSGGAFLNAKRSQALADVLYSTYKPAGSSQAGDTFICIHYDAASGCRILCMDFTDFLVSQKMSQAQLCQMAGVGGVSAGAPMPGAG